MRGRFAHSEGKGEEYAEAIGRRHFEMKQSAVELPNLLDAALEVRPATINTLSRKPCACSMP